MVEPNYSSFINSTKWASRADELFYCFDRRVDVVASMRTHMDIYGELVNYMLQHLQPYSYNLDDTSKRWVPKDLLSFVHDNDKNFNKRLKRFVDNLTEDHFVTVDEDLLIRRNIPNVGLCFISWEMTCIFLILEADDEPQNPGLGKLACSLIHEQAQEPAEQEELIDPQIEASLALSAMAESLTIKDVDQPPVVQEGRDVDMKEVEIEAPNLIVELLLPVVIQDKEYLFLIDLQHVFGLREDEALSALAVYEKASNVDYDTHDAICPEFMAISDTERAIAEVLQKMKTDLVVLTDDELNQVQKTFPPKKDYVVGIVERGSTSTPGSSSVHVGKGIDISQEEASEADEENTESFEIDVFARRTGGMRATSSGRDSSLGEYIGLFQKDSIVVFHRKYSPHGKEELLKCRAFSKSLCEKTLDSSGEKVILILRQLAIQVFGGKYGGKLATTAALGSMVGVENEKTLVRDWGGTLLGSRRKSNVVKRLRK